MLGLLRGVHGSVIAIRARVRPTLIFPLEKFTLVVAIPSTFVEPPPFETKAKTRGKTNTKTNEKTKNTKEKKRTQRKKHKGQINREANLEDERLDY